MDKKDLLDVSTKELQQQAILDLESLKESSGWKRLVAILSEDIQILQKKVNSVDPKDWITEANWREMYMTSLDRKLREELINLPDKLIADLQTGRAKKKKKVQDPDEAYE